MKKETLTVETDEDGTITYRNASGQLHNSHGPAVVWENGDKACYINGCELNEAEFKAWQAGQSAPLHNKIAVIDGIEYTLTAK